VRANVAEIPNASARASETGPVRRGDIRSPRRRLELVRRLVVIAADGFSLAASHWVAATAVESLLRVPPSALEPQKYLLFCLPFLLVVMYLFERGHSIETRRPEKELELVVKGVSLSFALLICVNFVLFKGLGFSRYFMLGWYVAALLSLLCTRFVVRAVYVELWKRGRARRRTLLMGLPESVLKLQEALGIQRFQGFELVGTILVGGNQPCDGLRVLGPLERWEDVVREEAVEQVFLCLGNSSESEHRLVSEILRGCLAEGIDVQIHSDLFGSREFHYELDEFSEFFRFQPAPGWPRKVQGVLKPCLDVLGGLVGSLLAIFLTPIVGLAIKLEDHGPIFYHSAYVGKDGGNRYYLKFRTMRLDADRVLEKNPELRRQFLKQQKLASDPRVTRVGRILRKYSLDEFPQFFHVLRGDLSLVGPRTIRCEEGARYGVLLPKLLSFKPGLTGFWQVMGRQLTTYEERVRMDMFYIDHWSLWLDVWIIAKTFWKVLRAEGAY